LNKSEKFQNKDIRIEELKGKWIKKLKF
jgi:hypothetical protein